MRLIRFFFFFLTIDKIIMYFQAATRKHLGVAAHSEKVTVFRDVEE